MNLLLQRKPSLENATIGELYDGETFLCFTLEDVVREITAHPVSQWKVAGKTAIPAGSYKVIITQSVRFKRELPLLVNVPGFTGVRIHPGNTSEDTEGCILVGTQVMGESIVESRKAFQDLFERLKDAFGSWQNVHITIKNPPEKVTI